MEKNRFDEGDANNFLRNFRCLLGNIVGNNEVWALQSHSRSILRSFLPFRPKAERSIVCASLAICNGMNKGPTYSFQYHVRILVQTG